MKKALLIDGPFIIVSPFIAKKIGLNEAIILQHIHYWISHKKAVEIESKKWCFNTYQAWEEQLPFFSKNTIQRSLIRLEKELKLVISNRFKKEKGDCTKYYSIDYEELKASILDTLTPNWYQASPQIGATLTPNWCDPHPKLGTSTLYNNITTKNTSKKKINKKNSKEISNPHETNASKSISCLDNLCNNNDFEVFWKAYPVKKNKHKAQEAFVKAIKNVSSLSIILDAINAQSSERAQKSSRCDFVPEWPYPSTWLNQKRWMDEIEPLNGIPGMRVKREIKSFAERDRERIDRIMEQASDTSDLGILRDMTKEEFEIYAYGSVKGVKCNDEE